MAFWSSEKFKAKAKELDLINPYEEEALKHAAYELAVGEEVFLSSFESGTKRLLKDGDQISIPPGQFGLLITKEVVKVPCDAIAFISIRASIKFRGLVNISGFHVDPGFEGKLKFSVYNAGSQAIVLGFGQRIFMLWYANLDQETQDGYGPARPEQNILTGKNVEDLQGEIASPGALKKQFDDLRQECQKQIDGVKQDYDKRMAAFDTEVEIIKRIALVLFGLIAGAIVTTIIGWLRSPSQSTIGIPPAPTPTPKSVPTAIRRRS